MQLKNDSLRQEVKYKVFFKDIGRLFHWINSQSMFSRSYEDRSINSLYYDTPNFEFAMSNMSGESRRVKIRARWYSKINESAIESFLKHSQEFKIEIKRKVNNLSDKLNIANISASNDINFIKRKERLNNDLQKYLDAEKILNSFRLSDRVLINYKRKYFESIYSSDIRMTVDDSIHYSNSQLPSNLNLLSKNFVIVELKFHPHHRDLVNELMSTFPFRQVRYSKYLAAVAQIKQVSY